MKIIFARKDGDLVSKFIRMYTWSKWSHVGIIDGDYVLESIGCNGVTKTKLKDFKLRYTNICIRYIKGDIEKARNLVGKEFDMLGMCGGMLHLNVHSLDKYFCSEYVAYASYVFDDDYTYKVSPENLFWASTLKPQKD
jgi:hypothetical protein